MNVFLIGGTGFISSYLVRALLDAGHHVATFTRGKSSRPIEPHPRLEMLEGDRHDEAALRAAVRDRTFDAAYDMVAYTPEESTLAATVLRGRVGRFIHCSTISVYMVSDDVQCPVTEDQDKRPLMEPWPRNPFGMDYGLQKRRCEDVLWEAHDAAAFPVTMLRPTYVSGPTDPTRRDHFWIERLRDGQPLLVPGSGDVAFQQVYVGDVARAFAAVLDHPASVGEAYNVAAEEVQSLNEYLHRLGALLDRDPVLVHVDQAVFDRLPFSTYPGADVFPFNTRRTAVFSLEKIRRGLGYRSTPFAQWMPLTIAWYTEQDPQPSAGYEHRAAEVAFLRRWQAEQRGLVARLEKEGVIPAG